MKPTSMRNLILATLAALSTCGAETHPAVVSSVLINGDAPYPESHASTIAETPTGDIVAAWFGGTKERNPDVCIRFARFGDGRWSECSEVADGVLPDGTRQPTWNPVLFAPEGAPLQLFYKVGPHPSKWWGMVKTSGDLGRTWSEARRLPDGILGPIKNKPVVLSDGTWLSPSSSEGNPNGWLVHFERSSDRGATWEKTPAVGKGPSFDAIQPSLLIHGDGRLQALCRSKQGVVAQTWSEDGGKSWSKLTAAALPNPNSGTDAVTLSDGRHLMVYNHSAHRPHEAKGNRWPLAVAVSDDGLEWERVVTLETEPCKSGYAYPAVIQARDGRVHITYTVDRKAIRHVVIDPTAL